ncbi:c-type cytochrome [Sabulicella rubraurantiaca]|uniref:c-type cytochrome n=1 Tax=Sabulicella rubraurantiaca TaxID=2811429 RepID=UPI001A958389|nr:c-type cytochrome [Sabulicella rubraurantiaca]
MLPAAALLAAAFSFPAPAQDATRGAAVAEARQCQACHGPQGRSEIPEMPSLAGQQEDFVTMQLILFREGLRRVPAMTEAARGLTDTEAQDLAAYFSSLPSGPKPDRGSPDPALMARGGEVAASRNCNACHLPNFAGRANVPRVNHQREDYLLHTLTEYRDGVRVGADTQMNGLLYGLTDYDLRAVAHFLAHQE